MKANHSQRSLFKRVVIAIIVLWLTIFVLFPNLMIVVISFLSQGEVDLVEFQFSLSNYTLLFEPFYASLMLHSIKMAMLATLFCLLLGYPFAFILAKLPHKLRPIMLFLLIVPFWTNSLIRIYGLKAVISTNGLLNKMLLSLGIIEKPLSLMLTEQAVILGLVYILLPFMVLPLYSSIEKLDKHYLEAARDLGANRFETFLRIIFPLTLPGIIAGCLLVFLPAMGMFYVSDLLGGKNLLIGNVIKDEFLKLRNWPVGSAISICLTLAMTALIYLYYRLGKFLNRKVELE